MIAVRMPQVGENLTTGILLEWSIVEGDRVQRGDVLAVVESEKAAFEVTAEGSGVLLRIDCPAGQQAQVLDAIAWIGEPGESIAATPIAGVEAPLFGVDLAPRMAPRTATATSAGHAASPSARRVARQLLVDLTRIRGTGPGGRIIKRDVLSAALAESGATPVMVGIEPVVEGRDRVEPHGRLRAAIAERMSLSARSVPHFYLFIDVDVTDAQQLRTKLGADPALSLTDLIVAATARSLRQHERLNAHVGEREIVLKAGCHIGLAVAVDGGILVPALADADRHSLPELAALRHQAIDAARAGVVAQKPSPTFTITSLAGYGVERFLPIINPPECAILAVGHSGERVIAVAGAAVVREQMTLCLACDHRAVDGAGAAAFLQSLKGWLEEPARLIDNDGEGE